jgi:hypothetical protein
MKRFANNPSVRVCGNYAYLGFGRQAGDPDYLTLAGSYAQYVTLAGSVPAGGTFAYTGPTYVPATKTRIAIDPNVRVRGNATYAGFEDVEGPMAVGEQVEVYEAESGLTGEGRVTEIDAERKLVYLSVDWSSLKDAESGNGAPNYSSSPASAGVVYISDVGGVSATADSWFSLATRPSLAYVGFSDMTLSITAPAQVAIYDAALPSKFSPYLEILQPFTELRHRLVVTA